MRTTVIIIAALLGGLLIGSLQANAQASIPEAQTKSVMGAVADCGARWGWATAELSQEYNPYGALQGCLEQLSQYQAWLMKVRKADMNEASRIAVATFTGAYYGGYKASVVGNRGKHRIQHRAPMDRRAEYTVRAAFSAQMCKAMDAVRFHKKYCTVMQQNTTADACAVLYVAEADYLDAAADRGRAEHMLHQWFIMFQDVVARGSEPKFREDNCNATSRHMAELKAQYEAN